MKKGNKLAAKYTSYAILSSFAFASLVGSPAIVAHADVQLTGDTEITNELVITKQVEIEDKTGRALENTTLIIKPEKANSNIDVSRIAPKNIIIANDNVTEIKVADEKQVIQVESGVKPPKIVNKDNIELPKAVEIVKSLSNKVLGLTAASTESSNENIAKAEVTEDGIKVVAKAEGKTTITVKDKENNKVVVSVTVSKVNGNFNIETLIEKPKANFNLSIMHTNDTHASLDGIAKTVTAVKEVRVKKPDALLLNAGDVFSGTLYFNEFHGKADLDFMNLMKYDAMTFGNHEFDLGSSSEGHKALADFIVGANFPFVSANVNFEADEKFQGLFSDLVSSEPENGKIYNGIVKEINGERVGIFGLTTAETADISSPGKITFEDYKKEAEKAVKAFENMGIDKIVAITHIGYDDNAAVDNDLLLAAEVEGIDVIVGGHTHTALNKPVIVSKDETPTIIVQTGANNSNLGVLDVEFDDKGVVVKHEGQLIAIGSQVEDAEAKAKLAKYKEEVDAVSSTEIGVSADVPLLNPRTGDKDNTTGESVRKNETILGNLITDGMLSKAKDFTDENVIMALQNGGGIRASINQGPITVGEVIKVLPFGNTLAVMNVTGAELKEAFEISLGSLPGENGGFLHVSGAKVKYDSSKPKGERVVSIEYKDSDGKYDAIKGNETYKIATNAFTAQGGDGFIPFAKAYAEGRVTDLGLSDWENFREHLVSLKEVGIPTEIEGRILDVAGQQNPETEIPGGIINQEAFSGSTEKVKVYSSDVTVSITDLDKLENAVVKGNLTIKGEVTGEFTLLNITVQGDLNYSDLEADSYNLNGITVEGNTIS
ncbi:bifunctional metallophosphatase/5'-nucleotidase [Solibacillus silvestris]